MVLSMKFQNFTEKENFVQKNPFFDVSEVDRSSSNPNTKFREKFQFSQKID